MIFTATLGAEELIVNGNFESWTGGTPDGWRIDTGAQSVPGGRPSEVRQMRGPALVLRGNGETAVWRSVSQVLQVRAGSLTVKFQSRTRGIKREPGQFNNCYVGVWCFRGGKVVAREIEDVAGDTTDWTEHEIDVAIPEGTESAHVTIFLSKTGVLAVRDVSATADIEESLPVGGTNLLVNGSLTEWEAGLPKGWTVEIGARNGGDAPVSKLQPLDGGGLVLSGDARTLAWRFVGQSIPVKQGRTYELSFTARGSDIRQETTQFKNAYVGCLTFDADGNGIGAHVEDVSAFASWQTRRLQFDVPPGVASAKFSVFLSQTGALMVKDLALREVTGRP